MYSGAGCHELCCQPCYEPCKPKIPESIYFVAFVAIIGMIIFFWVCFVVYAGDPIQWIALTIAVLATILFLVYMFGWHNLIRW